MRRILLVYSFPVLIAPIVLAILVNWPATINSRMFMAVLAEWIGQGIGVALIGSIGLVYRPNRFAGLIVGIAIASLAWLAGVTDSKAFNVLF